MGNLFWVPPKVLCPEKIVKGTGFNSIEIELSVGSYKIDMVNSTWLYVYEENDVGFLSFKLKPIEITPEFEKPCIMVRLNEKDFVAGKSYIFKWYNSSTIFASVIAKSNVLEVTDISHEVQKAAELQAVKMVEFEAERKVALQKAMAAASLKADEAKEQKRLQDAVDDLVRRQREEQLKLMKLQAQTAKEMYENESLRAAQSDEISLHHHHDRIVMESREVSSVESDIFQEYFDQIDTNHDGKISMKELEGFLSKCGLKVAKKQLLNMFHEADVDHSGAIDFYEFIAVMRHTKDYETSAQWEKVADKVNKKIKLINEKQRAREFRDQMLADSGRKKRKAPSPSSSTKKKGKGR